jgi:hypothetical protein
VEPPAEEPRWKKGTNRGTTDLLNYADCVPTRSGAETCNPRHRCNINYNVVRLLRGVRPHKKCAVNR